MSVKVKVSRGGLKAHALGLLQAQGGNCAVCGLPVDLTTQGRNSDYVVDHCHVTGVIRGVLHRSCNSCLGKAEKAIGSWGSKSGKIEDIIPYMEKMIAYYKQGLENPSVFLYPTHKTPLEKKEAERIKRQKQRVQARIRKAMNAKGVN